MANGKSNPLDAALARLKSILEQACWQAKAFRLETMMKLPLEARFAMIVKELVIRDAISKSCREWIETGNLMPMRDEDAKHFYYRLHYGDKLLRWVRSGDCYYPSKSSNQILQWVLIDSWPEISVELWKSDLLLDD